MSEPRITAAITSQRAELARREVQAVRSMVDAYDATLRRLDGELTRLTAELEAIYDAGEVPTIGRLFRTDRTRSLLLQAAAEFDRFGREVGATMDGVTRDAIRQAERDAGALTKIALGEPPPGAVAEALFTKLPTDAIQDIAATTRTGPLAELLAQFGSHAARDARTALITGIALGEHPTRVAKRLKDALGTSLSRATTIARTEQLRAYREGHRRWYDANSKVVKAYVWHSALGRNTCVACWAMHGKEFDTKEPMGTHPNCRCAMVPKSKTWRELGFNVSPDNESTVTITPGRDLFARLKPTEQLHILGPRAYRAYRAGEVDITDFVHIRRSADWGVTRSRGTLRRALAKADAREEVIEAA